MIFNSFHRLIFSSNLLWLLTVTKYIYIYIYIYIYCDEYCHSPTKIL
ncbi:MAG: hypothetical protein MCS20_01025 [Candidatus Phytoplasma mali]|nr:hypothetical protein [Candidatus Karelsulcia muelleri]MCG7201983.1 hypothetical protein [Candidatus Phytoplasma mali]